MTHRKILFKGVQNSMYFVRVASTVGQDVSLVPIRFAGTGDMLAVTREMSSILDSSGFHEEVLENNG